MVERSKLVEVVRGFTSAMLQPYDLEDLLQRLSDQAAEVLEGHGAGILLRNRSGDLEFVAATNDAVEEAERRQAHLHTGACYEAFATNQLIVVQDPDEARRWPGYWQMIEELQLRSVIGVPLNAGGETIGALNIYRRTPTRWSDDDVELAEVLAAMGTAYILNANELRQQQDLAAQLQEALDSRSIIERAKGVLMERERISAEEAFELLRAASQKSNRKLRDLARDLLGANR